MASQRRRACIQLVAISFLIDATNLGSAIQNLNPYLPINDDGFSLPMDYFDGMLSASMLPVQ
jgi:hypothetical protein